MESIVDFYNAEQMTGQFFLQSQIKTLVPPLSSLLSLTRRSLFTSGEFVSVSCCELNQRQESTLPAQQGGRVGPEKTQTDD